MSGGKGSGSCSGRHKYMLEHWHGKTKVSVWFLIAPPDTYVVMCRRWIHGAENHGWATHVDLNVLKYYVWLKMPWNTIKLNSWSGGLAAGCLMNSKGLFHTSLKKPCRCFDNKGLVSFRAKIFTLKKTRALWSKRRQDVSVCFQLV